MQRNNWYVSEIFKINKKIINESCNQEHINNKQHRNWWNCKHRWLNLLYSKMIVLEENHVLHTSSTITSYHPRDCFFLHLPTLKIVISSSYTKYMCWINDLLIFISLKFQWDICIRQMKSIWIWISLPISTNMYLHSNKPYAEVVHNITEVCCRNMKK